MKRNKIVFWITTGFIFLFEGVMPALTSNSQLAIDGVRHLGYPDYFRIMLTFFKVAGALALVLPAVPGRVKEWAYAGFSFIFISAAVSHYSVDGFDGQTVFPLVMLGILFISYSRYRVLSGGSPETGSLPAIATVLLLGLAPASEAQTTSHVFQSGYAPVNGIKMYYEVHGEGAGTPLVLVHGSFMNIPLNWGHVLPELSKTRKVIALELQGHGRTADTSRPYSYDGMADDVAALIRYLNIGQADVLGYSLGGAVAINTAIRHPDVVRKLVVVSATSKTEGWQQQVRDILPTIQPEFFEPTPLKTTYDSLAPDPKHFGEFVRKLAAFNTQHFDFGDDKVRNIQAPVMLVVGDSDGVLLENAVAMFRLWGGGVFGDMAGLPRSQFAVVPASTHTGLMMRSDWITQEVPDFLDKNPSAEPGSERH